MALLTTLNNNVNFQLYTHHQFEIHRYRQMIEQLQHAHLYIAKYIYIHLYVKTEIALLPMNKITSL